MFYLQTFIVSRSMSEKGKRPSSFHQARTSRGEVPVGSIRILVLQVVHGQRKIAPVVRVLESCLAGVLIFRLAHAFQHAVCRILLV